MNYSRKQLEALGEPLGDSVTRKEGGRIIYGGGGGSSAPSSTTQIVDLPDWAKPYAQETLEKTKQITAQPYQTYDQPRIAGFSPMQQQAQEAASRMGTSGQLGTGTGLATAAGLMGLGASYQPGYFGNQFRAPGAYQTGQFGYLGAQAPDLQQFQMGPAERVAGGQYTAPEMTAAQTEYRPDLTTFQMGPAERVRTGSFTQPGMAERYMSPYVEQALAPQLREAQRASQIAGTQEAGQAVKMGAFGGSRAGLIEAERQRNLATQMGDIRARGLQTAFEQAQGLYGTEAQRQLAAQQANQQAGLTVGGQNLAAALGVQQLGAQTGLQAALANLNNQQQAALQNQAAQLQTQGLTAGQAMQAALANQQAGLNVGQQNLAAQLGIQQLGAGQDMQAQLANQQAYQQAQAQREASRQFGYGQAMTAAQQRAQFGQAAQQLGEQSRQFGAGFGQQGLNTALQAAGQLGNLGQAEFGQQKDILGLQSQFGAQQQALQQQGLSQAYQDFLNQQNHPYKQLGFMSDMIRGLPLGQQSTSQVYQAPGNMMGQLGGIGMGLYGMSRLMGAEGGEVKEYADGGSVTSDYKVDSIIKNLSDVQLQQARLSAINSQDQRRVEMIDDELAERASLRSGIGSAFNSLPEETQESVTQMANGGIVAFDDGGKVERYSDGGTMSSTFGFASTDPTREQEALALDEERRQRVLANRRAAEDEERMKFLKTSAPEVHERIMAERRVQSPPPKPASPPVAAPAPEPKREARVTSAPSITRKDATETVSTLAAAAKIEIPKDETQKLAREIFAELNAKSEPERLEFKRELESAKNRAKEIEARGIGEAMMKFGFGMAAAASKPGVARRSGLAGALESAAAASPILAESMAENQKLQQAAQDNYLKLRMENSRYQNALEQGNMQLAANIANGISQRQLTQADLEQRIAQNQRTFDLDQKKLALEERKIGIMQAQGGSKTAIQKIADDLQSADPKLDRTAALNEASRISGYSFKGADAAGGKLQTALSKIEDDYKILPALMASNPDSALVKQLTADRQRRREEAMRLYGGQQQTGVGSAGVSQVYRFDSKGNPIQ